MLPSSSKDFGVQLSRQSSSVSKLHPWLGVEQCLSTGWAVCLVGVFWDLCAQFGKKEGFISVFAHS